jgi:adenylate cyclase
MRLGSQTVTAGIEIERKFLPEKLPADLEAHPSTDIEQGYLSTGDDGPEVRIRRHGDQFTLTIKSSGARERVEEELSLDERMFRSLWPLSAGRRVEKTRYRISRPDGLTVELDVYHGRLDGLVTAEVEFRSRDAADSFDPPSWFGHEVTDDGRYKNKRLATDGLPG